MCLVICFILEIDAECLLKKNYEDLVKTLPFKDAFFQARLQTAGLYFGDLKQKVEAKETSAEMAMYFLDHGINDNLESFEKLLTVMEKFDHSAVQCLARKIRGQWQMKQGTARIYLIKSNSVTRSQNFLNSNCYHVQ